MRAAIEPMPTAAPPLRSRRGMKLLGRLLLSLTLVLASTSFAQGQDPAKDPAWAAQREALRAFIESEEAALRLEEGRVADLEAALASAERVGDRLRLTLEVSWWSGLAAGATLGVRLISSPRFRSYQHKILAIGGVLLGAAVLTGVGSSFYLDLTEQEAETLRIRIGDLRVHQNNRRRAIEDMRRQFGEDLSGFQVKIEGPYEETPPAAP